MRRLLALLLALTLLAGCTVTVPVETTQPTEEPTTVTTDPPRPSLYDPNSSLEHQTNGAVRAYPLHGYCDGMVLLNQQVVLYYLDEQMQLKAYSGDLLTLDNTTVHHVTIPENGGALQVSDKGIFYYNPGSGTLVVLDSQLRQQKLMELPEDIRGIPVINADLDAVYYCTSEGIRTLNLSTGIAHMLRQQEAYTGVLTGQCFDGKLLMCHVTAKDGSTWVEFVSAETGLQAGKDQEIKFVESFGETFFLNRGAHEHGTYLFGIQGGELSEFLMPEDGNIQPVLEMGGVLITNKVAEGYVLDFYHLESGKRTASVTLAGMESLRNVTPDPRGYIWFMDEDTLYRWDLGKSPLADEEIYTSLWYTGSDPNEEGLAKCQDDAAALGQKYGIEIRIWQDAVKAPWDKMTPEFRVSVYESALQEMELILSQFPEDMLKKMGSICDSKQICISIVADTGAESSQVSWVDGNVYIAVEAGQIMTTELLRSIYRVMDTYILTKNSMLDEWNADKPAEDRTRFFVEAMTAANDEFFEKRSAQNKLRTLCRAIRRAFDMRKYAAELPWEQYLDKPLY